MSVSQGRRSSKQGGGRVKVSSVADCNTTLTATFVENVLFMMWG